MDKVTEVIQYDRRTLLETRADAVRVQVSEDRQKCPKLYPFWVLSAIAGLRASHEADSADVEAILLGSVPLLQDAATEGNVEVLAPPVEGGGKQVAGKPSLADVVDALLEDGYGAAPERQKGCCSTVQEEQKTVRALLFESQADHSVRATASTPPLARSKLPTFTAEDRDLTRFKEGDRVYVYTERIDQRPMWRRAIIAPFVQHPPALEWAWNSVPGLWFHRYMVRMADTGEIMGPFRTALKEIRPNNKPLYTLVKPNAN